VKNRSDHHSSEVAEIKSWLTKNQQGILEDLEETVAINSFTTNIAGANLVISYFEKEFSKLGLTVSRIPCKEAGDVIVADTPAVKSDNYFILSGHIDTVHPPESSFSKLTLQDKFGFGPGVLDMKGGVVVILWALYSLAQRAKLNDIPVRIIINSDEETGSRYSNQILSEYSKGARAALVFEHGRNQGGVITRRKGVSMLELEAFGKSGHAGNAHKDGRNAIVAISKAILEISELTDYDKGTTINVGVVSGGTTTNTVPDYARATIDLRYKEQGDYKAVCSAFDQICKQDFGEGLRVSYSELVGFPAMVEDKASRELAASFVEAAKIAGVNRSILDQVVGGGSDASRFSSLGVPSIDGLGPSGAHPHTDQEHIELDSMQECILSLASWMLLQNN